MLHSGEIRERNVLVSVSNPYAFRDLILPGVERLLASVNVHIIISEASINLYLTDNPLWESLQENPSLTVHKIPIRRGPETSRFGILSILHTEHIFWSRNVASLRALRPLLVITDSESTLTDLACMSVVGIEKRTVIYTGTSTHSLSSGSKDTFSRLLARMSLRGADVNALLMLLDATSKSISNYFYRRVSKVLQRSLSRDSASLVPARYFVSGENASSYLLTDPLLVRQLSAKTGRAQLVRVRMNVNFYPPAVSKYMLVILGDIPTSPKAPEFAQVLCEEVTVLHGLFSISLPIVIRPHPRFWDAHRIVVPILRERGFMVSVSGRASPLGADLSRASVVAGTWSAALQACGRLAMDQPVFRLARVDKMLRETIGDEDPHIFAFDSQESESTAQLPQFIQHTGNAKVSHDPLLEDVLLQQVDKNHDLP